MRLSGVRTPGMCGPRVLGLLSVIIAVVSSGTLYVRSGENITDCMESNQTKDILNLYRECGGKWDHLLEFRCDKNDSKTHNSRILLNTSSRCWTLPDAVKSDSCLYTLRYTNPKSPDVTKDVRVLDHVLDFNIFTSSSLQGLNMTVSVYYSAGPVTLEENGEPLRLIDDNRTLIIPSVQRDDAERRFRVRITNPVSEEIWDCQLNIGDSDLAVLSNITCNISRLGEEMAVNVLLSVEGNATTWEVDGEVPHGYQLKEGNKMIPSVHRNNTKQRLGVGITILVSNETWKYWRENRENYQNGGNEGSTVGIVVGTIVGIGVFALVTVVVIICIKHRNRSRNQIPGWVRACYHRA